MFLVYQIEDAKTTMKSTGRKTFKQILQHTESTNHNREVNRDRSDWYAKGWRYLFCTLATEGAWVSLYLALAVLSS